MNARSILPLLALLALLLPAGVCAQLQPPTASSADLGLLLRQLDGEKRVLMVAAHPDDEDTSLLTALARGAGARTAYLSLTRGEGGQNLIGPELGEGLGVIRTGELMSARALDGAEQYFSRAYDFGYSRVADETFDHWPREELVRDVTEVIRHFRPHLVVSIFTGTERDGHGQHQAAGIVTADAFEAAADPDRFPDQLERGLEPWAPARLYRSTRFRPDATTLEVATGVLDPLLGRSHFQIAMASRSRHRSQDMGSAEAPGPRSTGLELVRTRLPARDGDPGLFAGIDTTLTGLARAALDSDEGTPGGSELVPAIEDYREALRRAATELTADAPGRVLVDLTRARGALERARAELMVLPDGPEVRELDAVLERRADLLAEATLISAGVVVELRADREQVVPGAELQVDALVWNAGTEVWQVEALELTTPDGWIVRSAGDSGGMVEPGSLRRLRYRISVPESAELSRLYYLVEDRDGSLYRWPEDPAIRTRPGNPPLIGATAVLGGPGAVEVERDAVHVRVDKAFGELHRPVVVVPALSVFVEPDRMAWPVSTSEARTVLVRVSATAGDESLRGSVALEAPEGWRTEPERRPFDLAPGGTGPAEQRLEFRVHPPAGTGAAGAVRLAAVAELEDGRRFDSGMRLIDYPHIDPVPMHDPAELRVTHLAVQVAEGLRVGYVPGSGDEGMRALRDLGVDVEAIGPGDFARADLSAFDALVLGIRAYETRADLVAANERLLEFAREGGTVVVQYNKYELPAGGFAPYPIEMNRPHDRVTNPSATVTLLDPDHPLLTRPNRLSDADFEGWVQERGLYFLSEWDDRYTPLLEMSDPDQPPNRGSLMVARVGDGAWIYTGLALFRQLPAGVPGAYRILANLVSLSGSDLPATASEGAGRP